VLALAAHQASASGRAQAKGGISIANSEDIDVRVDFDNRAYVGANADVLAGDTIEILAHSAADVVVRAWASGAGFGADGRSRSRGWVGKDGGADTTVQVLGNASLVANRVNLGARVSNLCVSKTLASTTATCTGGTRVSGLRIDSRSESYGAGFYGEGLDDAYADADLDTGVTIAAGAQITGWEGVAVLVRHDDVSTYAKSFARATGLFGYVDADSNNTTDLASTFSAAATARITAGPGTIAPTGGYTRLAYLVDVTNDVPNDAVRQDADVSRRALAAGGADEHGSNLVQTRTLAHHANVTILSGRSPELVIAADGTIAKAVEVTVNGKGQGGSVSGDTQLVLSDIVNKGPGDVLFRRWGSRARAAPGPSSTRSSRSSSPTATPPR
jgi:hypothetical protein